MPRCSKCGELNSPDDVYCWRCGARLPPEFKMEGVDTLISDFRLQSLWGLRFLAYIIDFVIVGVLGFLLSVFAFVPLMVGSLFGGNWAWSGIWAVPLYLGLVQVVYSAVLELVYGATFGKQILGLVVATRRGKPGLYGAVIRNLSKLHWVLLLIDFAAGVLQSHVPRDKYLDKISGTYVTYSGGGIRIPFLARPSLLRKGSSEIVPVENLTGFDPFALINLGVFLVVSTTILVNSPETLGALISWLVALAEGGGWAPPSVLLSSGYWFFMAMGVWGVAGGILRYILRIYPLKSVQEIFNGVFSLALGVFIRLYSNGVFNFSFFAGSIVIFFIAQLFFTLYYSRYRG